MFSNPLFSFLSARAVADAPTTQRPAAYLEGFDAFFSGQQLNPYAADTANHEHWRNGYNVATTHFDTPAF